MTIDDNIRELESEIKQLEAENDKLTARVSELEKQHLLNFTRYVELGVKSGTLLERVSEQDKLLAQALEAMRYAKEGRDGTTWNQALDAAITAIERQQKGN